MKPPREYRWIEKRKKINAYALRHVIIKVWENRNDQPKEAQKL